MAAFELTGAGSVSWSPLSGDPERGDLRGGRMGGRDIWPKPPAPGWGRANGGGGGGGGEIEEQKGGEGKALG